MNLKLPWPLLNEGAIVQGGDSFPLSDIQWSLMLSHVNVKCSHTTFLVFWIAFVVLSVVTELSDILTHLVMCTAAISAFLFITYSFAFIQSSETIWHSLTLQILLSCREFQIPWTSAQKGHWLSWTTQNSLTWWRSSPNRPRYALVMTCPSINPLNSQMSNVRKGS